MDVPVSAGSKETVMVKVWARRVWTLELSLVSSADEEKRPLKRRYDDVFGCIGDVHAGRPLRLRKFRPENEFFSLD